MSILSDFIESIPTKNVAVKKYNRQQTIVIDVMPSVDRILKGTFNKDGLSSIVEYNRDIDLEGNENLRPVSCETFAIDYDKIDNFVEQSDLI